MRMSRFTLFCMLALCALLNSGFSAGVQAQEYFIKKEDNRGFLNRLFNRPEGQKPEEPAVRTSPSASDPFAGVKLEAPEVQPYKDAGLETRNVQDIQKEVFGECTPQERAAMEAFNKEVGAFEEAGKAFSEKGTIPKGYKIPDIEDPEELEEMEEEELQEIYAGGLHGLLMEPGMSGTVIDLMMRCSDWNAALAEGESGDEGDNEN